MAVGLSLIAGVNVLRNPIRTPLNAVQGCRYIVAAVAALWLHRWWPLPVGWAASLSSEGIEMWWVFCSHYNDRVSAHRITRGLLPLETELQKSGSACATYRDLSSPPVNKDQVKSEPGAVITSEHIEN